MARPRNTPNDPERRQRILTTTMELLQETGIASVTARSVATRAEVPVGSVSYYFDSVKGLLLQASQQLLGRRTAQIAEWDSQDTRGDAMLEQLAELIHHQLTTGRALTVVSYELYLLGLRDPDFQQVSAHTVGALRKKLLEHYSVERASHLAATADGYQLQALFDQEPPSVSSILTTLKSE